MLGSSKPHRSAIPTHQTWNLTGIYSDLQAWEADLARSEELIAELDRYRGRLGEGPQTLLACLNLREQTVAIGMSVMYYARNKQREDLADTAASTLVERATPMINRGNQALSWIKPEVLALPDGTIETFMAQEPGLRHYEQFLADWLAAKEHTLSPEAEAVFAGLNEVINSPMQLFHALNTMDVKVEPVKNANGELLHSFSQVLESADRAVRLAGYQARINGYAPHKHTLATNLATALKRDAAVARLRRYSSSLEAALKPLHLPESIYLQLLESSAAGSEHYRRYIRYRQRALGLDQMLQCDLWCPLGTGPARTYSFEEAFALVREALAPLGEQYAHFLEQAWQGRWIDWAENQGKMDGSAAFDCPGKHPLIMFTFKGALSDVFMLAHELGHAGNSYFTGRAQTTSYFGNPWFLGEIAATTNEVLLGRYLLAKVADGPERRQLLMELIGSFIGNFWDGSVMAAFQLESHRMAEQGEPLTWDTLCETYSSCLKRWYGDTVEITPEGFGSYWCRANHFLYGFYGYQYATGWTAAAAIAKAVLTEGAAARERYLTFLSAGTSARPLDLLKALGVDLTTAGPIEAAISLFGELVVELEEKYPV